MSDDIQVAQEMVGLHRQLIKQSAVTNYLSSRIISLHPSYLFVRCVLDEGDEPPERFLERVPVGYLYVVDLTSANAILLTQSRLSSGLWAGS